MKDITKTKLEVYISKTLDATFKYEGKSVNYAKVEFGVVKNPFTDKIEVAIKPLVKNSNREWVALYSYEEDLQYQYCMQVANNCMENNTPVPSDIDEFVRPMMQKKEFARKQADEHVRMYLSMADDLSVGFTRSQWREAVVNSAQAKALLAEYYNSNK